MKPMKGRKNKLDGLELPIKTGDSDRGESKEKTPANLKGEYWNLSLLMVLYTLQGIPMGLSGVLPLLLKDRGASYSALGTFSLVSWPFSMKLLWAPIVDAWYVPSFGRRKTWMVPSQMAIGVTMIVLSWWLMEMIDGVDGSGEPQILPLTVAFFWLYFLCATQDIAVDGWCLTMLRRENVGYGSTVNAFGQVFGYTISFTGFMALEHFQLVTLPGFMFFWGVVFLVVTTMVTVWKKETPAPGAEDVEPEDIKTTYLDMLKICQLPSIRRTLVLLFTWKLFFAPADAISGLKMQELGVSKDVMAWFATASTPVHLIMPVLVSRWAAGRYPLDLAMWVYPFRVMLTGVAAVVVFRTPTAALQSDNSADTPWEFYTVVMALIIVQAALMNAHFVGQMGFFAKVSDPAIGGTYMTLLNTLSNLGGMWTTTAALKSVEWITEVSGYDGYYLMSALATVAGMVYYMYMRPVVHQLGRLKDDAWRVRH